MFKIVIKRGNPVIIVDTGYYVFYRYYATSRWFSFQNRDVSAKELCEKFTNAFMNHCKKDILKLCKTFHTVKENIIFCIDCNKSDIWRNDIYNQYKGGRVHNDNFNKEIFDIFKDSVIPNIGLNTVNFDRLEADDIAYIVHTIILEKFPNEKMIIITNDNDYLQLVKENVKIYNMQMKDISSRGMECCKNELFMKALRGDKSDNIEKVIRISKSNAETLCKLDWELKKKWLIENNCYDKFMFNMKLINFEEIPESLIANCKSSIEIISCN
jgi:5'-3' exonuclease